MQFLIFFIGFQSTLPQGERPFSASSFPSLTDFNPRSHKGSDANLDLEITGISYFNPRSHKGSDYLYKSVDLQLEISIHAPTRGATLISTSSCKLTSHFNPRSHKGSDRSKDNLQGDQIYFNPRSHKGSDAILCLCGSLRHISIHAPTRGATIF